MAFTHEQTFLRIWTNIVASPLSRQPVRTAVLETGVSPGAGFPEF